MSFATQNLDYVFGPPSPITFIGPDGKLGLRPYSYAVTTVLDQQSFKWVFAARYEMSESL